MKYFCYKLSGLAILFLITFFANANIRPIVHSSSKGLYVQIEDDNHPIFISLQNDGAGLLLTQPGGTTEVWYEGSNKDGENLNLIGGHATGLEISESYRIITCGLIERTVTVTAKSDQRYYLDFGWKTKQAGEFYSFMGEEKTSKKYSPGCSGPEFGENKTLETFPFLGIRVEEKLYGIIGDTPGMWENRSFMIFDKENNNLSLCNGDGSSKKMIAIPYNVDATNIYRTQFDGWQHIEQGETQTWKTWILASDVKSLYDVQLSAHLALANAKGFNQSGIEAILRNTSYLLLRRNLTRPESDYIFISGVGYGWKQWVTDGFYMSKGLNDVKFDREANAAVFYDRLNYEDNAQYYLIWSLLIKRAGGSPDMRTVGRAYRFIRDHEVDGLYIPPRLHPDKKCYKTYHDQLNYDDDDAPSSNQGFHCGALMAAKELGFPVTDDDIAKAIAGYCRMFNRAGGYMATSLKQQENIGQDALYGEVLTYVVFGKKLLPDEMVKKHLETTMRIQSPYGMRVISKANGDLLDGHSGVYTNGGSWFLNDAANYLDGLIHGMDAKWVDDQLIWRLEKELAFMPAFHESISTVTGKPHGHHLYSWNSGYWWLRREVRKQLGLNDPDPVELQMDKELGISHRNGFLVLDPSITTLRPVK
ncbi:MAG: hypothetical protein A2W90_10620 [Bacteroidetes bacterium GWF2_42_66]|nr:MAG: hypothetical protein A2W89_01895 [Bacteroidetes bacterium GWE2_42_39]OFY43362.1 MAG: hypothetical protein A2W90_10620 [Bacteroidetes bacterium GWF2_42_66]HBL77454.1 hypothetical protein [Prolixibacteraceae bacterium]HCU61763.1 hypothetical protein [Prolixibacteraceae bacterium]